VYIPVRGEGIRWCLPLGKLGNSTRRLDVVTDTGQHEWIIDGVVIDDDNEISSTRKLDGEMKVSTY